MKLLSYDSANGAFVWKHNMRGPVKAGDPAGFVRQNGDYMFACIKVDGRIYRAHRLAWLYVTGEFPDNEIDHINGNPMDNRIENLRDATRMSNAQNHFRTGGVLPVGVFRLGEKYGSRIKVNYKYKHLGTFTDPGDAHQAYLSARMKYHDIPNGRVLE